VAQGEGPEFKKKKKKIQLVVWHMTYLFARVNQQQVWAELQKVT
jgi:hypothetical protein